MPSLRSLPLGALLVSSAMGVAQCGFQVTHFGGTAVVAGTSVTVTPYGFYTYYADCGSTSGPYLCGDGTGPGGFIFDFSPPVDSVMLDFSAIHTSGAYDEVMRVYVNGGHYAIPAASTQVNAVTRTATIGGRNTRT